MSSQSADGGRVGSAFAFVRGVAARTSEQDVTFLAAAVAYYAFVSLLPAAVLALVVATAVGGDQLADVVVAASADVLTPTGQEILIDTLQQSGGARQGATLISLLLTLWGTLKVFRGIDTAFIKIYGAVSSASIVDQLKDSLVVAASIGASFLAMVVVGSVIAALNLDVLLELLGVLVLPGVLTVAFLPIYYFFPEPRVSVREVLPGAVFAGVGWTVLQAGFQAYVGYQSASGGGQVELYGVVGGVLLLVTWLYFGAIILLVGVVVNVYRSERSVGFDHESGLGARPAADGRGGVHRDRHRKGLPVYARQHMSEDEREDGPAPDISRLDRQVAELRADLDDIDDRTVEKPALEAELKRYVRSRMRRGHARGWGPYLVLLYGVVLTLGAFAWLDGWFAIGAMVILFLSTLGLYVLFVLAGIGLNLIDVPGKAIDAVRKRR